MIQNSFRVRRAGLALVSAAVLMASGCTNQQVNTVGTANPPIAPSVEDIRKITLNAPLDRRAEVTSVFVGTDNDLLRVQANLRNNTNRPSWIQYHFDWFDERGLTIEGPADGTARTQLKAGERVNLSGLAPNPRAVDWRLTVRGL